MAIDAIAIVGRPGVAVTCSPTGRRSTMKRAVRVALGVTAVPLGATAVLLLYAGTAIGAPSAYNVVKVCSLVSLAEVKKLAPWAAHLDSFAKAEEEAVGTQGSSCNYPTAHVQVMAYRQETLDAARKAYKLDPVAGVGDEAYVRNNKGRFAELMARVGPHLLTVQLDIGTNQTYETSKPSLVALADAFAAKLR
jgi:hypothetical protein